MAAPGTKLKVSLLGELRLTDAAGNALPLPASRKTRAIFVHLLLCGRPIRRERLCEEFFDIPDDPRAALRWSLSKIRTMLGPAADALVADRERVELDRSAITTDVEAIETALREGAAEPRILELAERATEAALPGLEVAGLETYGTWLAAERAKIDRLRARLLQLAARQPSLTREERERFLEAAARAAPELMKNPAEMAVEASAGPTQTVQYCLAPDDVRIAYACTGEGAPLVKAANWLNHLELDWTGPAWGRLFHALSAQHCLIRYDERGNGLSDWEVGDLSFEAFVRDLETVVDGLGLERFALLGISQGCAVSIEYAARHPERVSKLVLLGGYAAGWRHFADAEEAARREAVITLAEHGWGQDNPVYRQLFSQTFIPSATPDELAWFNDFQRLSASPANAARFLRVFADIDVRHRLAEVRAPTLVLHSRGDQRVPLSMAIDLAAAIPGASLVTLETDSHVPLGREPATDKIIECVEAFLQA